MQKVRSQAHMTAMTCAVGEPLSLWQLQYAGKAAGQAPACIKPAYLHDSAAGHQAN